MMSTQAIREVARKLERLRLAQASTAEAIQKAKEKERGRLEELENVIAFMLDSKQASQTEIAKALGCSRDKMNRMAAAARKRNNELLRKGAN